MSLLRVFASLREPPGRCRWALLSEDREPLFGEGPLESLPRRAERVELVLPASDVLLTRARLPEGAKRRSGSVLAFAVEEQTLGEPDTHQVSWLGSANGADVLAVLDRAGVQRWGEALDAAGIRGYEIHCETLLLPWAPGEWTLAWDGREGFVRTAELEGTQTDCAEAGAPPLSLRMMLDEAKSRGEAPAAIAVYATTEGAIPDVQSWQRALGVALRAAGPWDWSRAPQDAGVSVAQHRPRWRIAPGTFTRLRPAAWIAGAALAIHACALVADWAGLAIEQRSLRQRMEARFRAAFPEALAVVDPGLQMRRKLAEARHAAGQTDAGDFLPMVANVAGVLHGAQERAPKVLSYESGRLALELAALDEPKLRRITARLLEAGLQADVSPSASGGARGAVLLTVRSQ